MFMSPGMANTLKRDANNLLNGLDGCNVIRHWQVCTGPKDVYGKASSVVDMFDIIPVRAHFSWTATLDQAQKQVDKSPNMDSQVADCILYFDKSVDLTMDGLYFDVQGVGIVAPAAKPPIALNSRPATLINGEVLLQEIYCKL